MTAGCCPSGTDSQNDIMRYHTYRLGNSSPPPPPLFHPESTFNIVSFLTPKTEMDYQSLEETRKNSETQQQQRKLCSHSLAMIPGSRYRISYRKEDSVEWRHDNLFKCSRTSSTHWPANDLERNLSLAMMIPSSTFFFPCIFPLLTLLDPDLGSQTGNCEEFVSRKFDLLYLCSAPYSFSFLLLLCSLSLFLLPRVRDLMQTTTWAACTG